jgi:hypothetical protein
MFKDSSTFIVPIGASEAFFPVALTKDRIAGMFRKS